jgi:hypothetical protein
MTAAIVTLSTLTDAQLFQAWQDALVLGQEAEAAVIGDLIEDRQGVDRCSFGCGAVVDRATSPYCSTQCAVQAESEAF